MVYILCNSIYSTTFIIVITYNDQGVLVITYISILYKLYNYTIYLYIDYKWDVAKLSIILEY